MDAPDAMLSSETKAMLVHVRAVRKYLIPEDNFELPLNRLLNRKLSKLKQEDQLALLGRLMSITKVKKNSTALVWYLLRIFEEAGCSLEALHEQPNNELVSWPKEKLEVLRFRGEATAFRNSEHVRSALEACRFEEAVRRMSGGATLAAGLARNKRPAPENPSVEHEGRRHMLAPFVAGGSSMGPYPALQASQLAGKRQGELQVSSSSVNTILVPSRAQARVPPPPPRPTCSRLQSASWPQGTAMQTQGSCPPASCTPASCTPVSCTPVSCTQASQVPLSQQYPSTPPCSTPPKQWGSWQGEEFGVARRLEYYIPPPSNEFHAKPRPGPEDGTMRRVMGYFPEMTLQLFAFGRLDPKRRQLVELIGQSALCVNELQVEQVEELHNLTLPEAEKYLYDVLSNPRRQKDLGRRLMDKDAYLTAILDHEALAVKLEIAKDKGLTVAHRRLGPSRVLTVGTEQWGRHLKKEAFYQHAWSHGLVIGLRRYVYFGHKDADKGVQGARCFFVALESRSYWDGCHPEEYELFHSIDEIRQVFGHFHMCDTARKMAARLGLLFSKTMPMDLSPELCNDIIYHDDDIKCQDGSVSTDGAGLILEEAVPMLEIFGGVVCERDREFPVGRPSILQVRGFVDGLIFKGTLFVVKKMPAGVPDGKKILIRPSMVKVQQDLTRPPNPSAFCSLEIVQTSRVASVGRLNRQLIMLLVHGGVPPQLFVDMTRRALEVLIRETSDPYLASRALANGRGPDVELGQLMLASGISLEEPYLHQIIKQHQADQLQQLAKAKVQLEDARNVMGTADFTGTLKEDQIMVSLGQGQLMGLCLVFRSPSVQVENVRRFEAVYCPELAEFVPKSSKNYIIFPTQGPYSCTGTMSGGDLDGDQFLVIYEPEIVATFKPRPPFSGNFHTPEPCPLGKESPQELSGEDLEKTLTGLWFQGYFEWAGSTGTASLLHMRHMDKHNNPDHEDCRELAHIYECCLDACKSGIKKEVPSHIAKDIDFPHYLEKVQGKTAHSKTILGTLYNEVKSCATVHCGGGGSLILQNPRIDMDLMPTFNDPEMRLKMGNLRLNYNKELWNILDEKNPLMMGLKTREKHERKNHMLEELDNRYLKMVYGEWEPSPESLDPPADVRHRASLIYQISMEKAINSASSKKFKASAEAITLLSLQKCMKQERLKGLKLAWGVLGRLLCNIKARRHPNMVALISLPALHNMTQRSQVLEDQLDEFDDIYEENC